MQVLPSRTEYKQVKLFLVSEERPRARQVGLKFSPVTSLWRPRPLPIRL